MTFGQINWKSDGPFIFGYPIPSVTITVRQATTLMFLLSDAAEFDAAMMRDLSTNEAAKVFEARRVACEEMSDVLNQRISEAHRAATN